MEDWRIGVLELVRRILIGLEADESPNAKAAILFCNS